MISGLSKEEFKLAKEVTNISLANAAESFSKIMKDEVTFTDIELNPEKLKFSRGYISASDHLFILITDFMGEVLADSFLIFNPENAQQTVNKMFGKECGEHMRDAVLLELDNILAASVATKFSDILERDIKGDVPKMKRLNYIKTQGFINEKLSENQTHFSFTTVFKSKRMGIEAHFVCAFRREFVEAIKGLAKEGVRDGIQLSKLMESAKRFFATASN